RPRPMPSPVPAASAPPVAAGSGGSGRCAPSASGRGSGPGSGAFGAGGNGSVRRSDRSEAERRAQVVDLVEPLPGEATVGGRATEVAVGRGALVDGAPEVEVAQDGGRAEVEHL